MVKQFSTSNYYSTSERNMPSKIPFKALVFLRSRRYWFSYNKNAGFWTSANIKGILLTFNVGQSSWLYFLFSMLIKKIKKMNTADFFILKKLKIIVVVIY